MKLIIINYCFIYNLIILFDCVSIGEYFLHEKNFIINRTSFLNNLGFIYTNESLIIMVLTRIIYVKLSVSN